jgi:hypothetical protein
MSELKNKDILVINESLLYLNNMKTAAWYQISKNLRAVKGALKEINDSKEDLIKNLSKKDENGQPIYEGEGVDRAVVFENPEEANQKWYEILNDVAPNIEWYKFNFEKFGDVELDALAIEPLIDVCLIED